MSRLPDLERELLGAAQRRFPAAGRRRAGLHRPRLRMLVPVAAVLLALVVGATALRSQDPEVEAPADPARSTLYELIAGPLGPALRPGGNTPADPAVTPVSLRVHDADGDAWLAAAYAARDGTACFSAATDAPGAVELAGGTNCVAVGRLKGQVALDRGISWGQPSEAVPPDGGSRIVYGVVSEDARAVEVVLGPATQSARLTDVFEMPVSDRERQAMERDGGGPGPAPLHMRLFAAAFTEAQAPGDPLTLPARARVTYADGEGRAFTLQGMPEQSEAACYWEPRLDAEVAELSGPGGPVQVCRRYWETVELPGPTPDPERLVACAAPEGAPRVFPGGPGVCADLGLEPYEE